jgi:hypothetical protein
MILIKPTPQDTAKDNATLAGTGRQPWKYYFDF